VHLLFPNLGIATGAEYWLTLHMVPLAPDRTRVEVRFRTMPLDTKTKTKVVAKAVVQSTRSKIARQASLLTHRLNGTVAPVAPDNSLRSTQITDEDRRAAEAIQRAVQ
jgi:Ring hydroxylating alpha subunit (catalytic domain)